MTLRPYSYVWMGIVRARFALAAVGVATVVRGALPLQNLPGKTAVALGHLGDLFLILSVASTFVIWARLGREILYRAHDVSVSDNIRQRRLRTQIDFIYRIVLLAIAVVGISTFLMTFEGARRIGASLIASAGIAGVVLGFAAQKSLGNLVAGFQIAFTQPMRLDDVVIVEKEWGRIEEITLTYVVVRLWDLRRLITPLNYFIEKPFENWTRLSADILAYFYLYVDYSTPIEDVRQALERETKKSSFWDKKVCLLQVTDFTEHNVQLRVLVSARNASDAFDLRCELRESLLKYFQRELPILFPKNRMELLHA